MAKNRHHQMTSARPGPPAPAAAAQVAPSPSAWSTEARAWRDMMREVWALRGALGVVVVLAALLRFITLGQHELWLDEASMFFDAQAHSFNNVSRLHVLHVRILGWFLDTLGESPYVLRLWSAIAGTLAVPLMAISAAWLAPADSDPPTRWRWALIGGVLAAVSPYLVYYSQDANYYGAMTLFAAAQWLLIIAFFRGGSLGATAAIVGVGLASHFTHPLGSLMTATALLTSLGGLFVDARVRAQWIALSPARWWRHPGLPLVVMALALTLWLAWEPVHALIPALMKRTERPPTPDVSWHPMFFIRAFSVYAFGLIATRLPQVCALGGLLLVGMLLGFARCLRNGGRLRRAVAVQLAGALTVSLVVVFTIKHHGFYPRYFTFLVPGFLLMGAVGVATLGEAMAARWGGGRRGWLRWTPPVVLSAMLLPATLLLFHPARRNAAAMTDVLARGYQPGDVILIPERNDLQQTAYYFPRANPPIPLDARVVVESADWLDQTTRSFLVHQLAGDKGAWIVSLRRGFQRPATLALIEDELGPPAYRGWSVESSDFDAILIEWDGEKRIELPHAAQRDGSRVIEPDIGSIGKQPIAVSPYDSMQFTDDRRNREAKRDDGSPILRRRFDGSVSHLVYSSPTDPRAIAIEVTGRPADAEHPLFVELAINGTHRGIWPAVTGEATGAAFSINTGIVLPPGNARVDVHGFSPRLKYDPYNDWEYGGLSLVSTANAPPSDPTWESTGVRFVPFPEPVLSWQRRPAMTTGKTYAMSVSPTVKGPSGEAALEIDLGDKPATAYWRAYTQPIVVGSAEYVAYSTYVKIEGTRSHAVSLATMWLDTEGDPMGSSIGTQQFLMARMCYGWSRFVEVTPVPVDDEGRRAAFVLPGVMVFPPDPDKPTQPGRVWVDAIASLHQATGPFAEPSLDPSLVFDVVEKDGVVSVASGS